MLRAEQLNRNKCTIIQKWFAHFTSKQSAEIMMWPESHIWGLQLITVPPPTVYLMELRHVHIHCFPSEYLHMPSFRKRRSLLYHYCRTTSGGFFQSKSVILLNGRHSEVLVSWKIQCQTAEECSPSLQGSPSNCSFTSRQTFTDGVEILLDVYQGHQRPHLHLWSL